jgi:hypothetical protein
MIRPDLHTRVWREHRRALIRAHGARCSRCNRAVSGRELHQCHVLQSARTGLVALMCRACHARYDAPRTQALIRRTLARRRGQLWLDPLVEYAPYAARDWPAAALAAAQGRLFS